MAPSERSILYPRGVGLWTVHNAGSGRQPPDGRRVHIVGSCNVGLRLTSCKASTRLHTLMRRQLRRPTKPQAALLGSHDPFATARADQLTFELGKTREHRDNQSAVRVRGVSPFDGHPQVPASRPVIKADRGYKSPVVFFIASVLVSLDQPVVDLDGVEGEADVVALRRRGVDEADAVIAGCTAGDDVLEVTHRLDALAGVLTLRLGEDLSVAELINQVAVDQDLEPGVVISLGRRRRPARGREALLR